MLSTVLAPKASKSFQKRLRDFDINLKAVFNQETERFEIWRYSNGRWHWIVAVENPDGGFRSLDERVFKKLYEMDIISRYGSIANWEKHMDELQSKWREGKNKEDDHKLKYDIKDDRKLWQRAEENLRSGVINDPPEEKNKKIISYSK